MRFRLAGFDPFERVSGLRIIEYDGYWIAFSVAVHTGVKRTCGKHEDHRIYMAIVGGCSTDEG